MSEKKFTGKISSIFFGIISAILFFLIANYLVRNYKLYFGKIDYAAWKKDVHGTNGLRLEIGDRIIAQRVLLDKDRNDVTELLGAPEETGYFKEYDMVYRLGIERGFIRTDSEWIAIKFKDGRVETVRNIRD